MGWGVENGVFEEVEKGLKWEGLAFNQLSPGRQAVWHW